MYTNIPDEIITLGAFESYYSDHKPVICYSKILHFRDVYQMDMKTVLRSPQSWEAAADNQGKWWCTIKSVIQRAENREQQWQDKREHRIKSCFGHNIMEYLPV